jgi:hypothetical protein
LVVTPALRVERAAWSDFGQHGVVIDEAQTSPLRVVSPKKHVRRVVCLTLIARISGEEMHVDTHRLRGDYGVEAAKTGNQTRRLEMRERERPEKSAWLDTSYVVHYRVKHVVST